MITTIVGPLPAGLVAALGVVTSVLTLLCVVPLCVQTVRNKAHPAVVTWGLWAPIGLVATVGMALGGAPWTAWLLKGFLSAGPLIVAVVAARYGGTWRTDRFDQTVIAVGVVGTIAYILATLVLEAPWAPYVAVGMAMLADGIAVWPTWKRAWRNPNNELIFTYAVALGCVLTGLIITPLPWTFLGSAILIFLALQMASIIGVLQYGRIQDRRDLRRLATPPTPPEALA
jgi:hypothetical protein